MIAELGSCYQHTLLSPYALQYESAFSVKTRERIIAMLSSIVDDEIREVTEAANKCLADI
ncbi:MAG: hypothetical protein HGA87_01310 [Desulfobulbaceae bacterium]|nr:hypothetical protein [Desulfobulbaceae bacterium]